MMPFEVREDQKENISFLISNRSANSWKALLSTSTCGTLDHGHQLFAEEISASELYENGDVSMDDLVTSGKITSEALDDPLDIYIRYFKWRMEMLGSETGFSTTTDGIELLPLLEKATRRFVDDFRYTQDRRYLNLWTSYAKQLDTDLRIDVFRFLLSSNIGTSHASLYEELALDLELRGKRLQEADSVYCLGISRRVFPVAQLKRRHAKFRERILVTSIAASSISQSALEGQGPPITGVNSGALVKNNNTQKYHDTNEQEKQNHKNWIPLDARKERCKDGDVESLPFTMGDKRLMETTRPFVSGIPASVLESDSPKDKTETELLKVNPFKNYESIPALFVMPITSMPPTASTSPRHFHQIIASSAENKTYPNFKSNLARNNTEHVTSTVYEVQHPVSTKIESKNADCVISTSVLYNYRRYDRLSLEEALLKNRVSKYWDMHMPLLEVNPDITRTVYTESSYLHRGAVGKQMIRSNNDSVKDVVGDTLVSGTPPLELKDRTTLSGVSDYMQNSSSFQVFKDGDDVPRDRSLAVQTAIDYTSPTSGETLFESNHSYQSFEQSETPQKWQHRHFQLPSPTMMTADAIAKLSRSSPTLAMKAAEQAIDDIFASQPTGTLGFENAYNSDIEGSSDDDYDMDEHLPIDPNFGSWTSQPFSDITTHSQDDGSFSEQSTDCVPQSRSFGGMPFKNIMHVMTPISERTEHTEWTQHHNESDTQLHSQAIFEGKSLSGVKIGNEGEVSTQSQSLPLCTSNPLRTEGTTVPRHYHSRRVSLDFPLAQSFGNPCDPFNDAFYSAVLRLPSHEPFQFRTFKRCEGSANKLVHLRRAVIRQSIRIDDKTLLLNFGVREFHVMNILGRGTFGSVFMAKESCYEDKSVAMKIESPCRPWEFVVLQLLHRHLPKRIRSSIIQPYSFYAYQDEGYLIMEYGEHGTLLDVVNRAAEYNIGPASGGLEEVLAVFFTIELLRVLESIHNAGVIHGDLKIDNVLLRLEDIAGGPKAWIHRYDPSGDGGWSHFGVKVIDFGRSIDTTLFPSSQTFVTDLVTDKYDCTEFRTHTPWKYQPDYYGLAGIAHCLLFGKYMETCVKTSSDGLEIICIKQSLKRYHQMDLWRNFFHVLLNPTVICADPSVPLTATIRQIRQDFEMWLVSASESSNSRLNIKSLLRKLDISMSC